MNEIRLKNVRPVSKHPAHEAMDLGQLYKNFSQGLKGYIISKFRYVDPEEVIQTVFLKMAQKSDLEKIEYPKSYLFRAADHVIYDDRRKRQVQNRYYEGIKDEDHCCDEMNPERIAEGKEELALITKAIKKMSPKKQRVLILFRIGGLSYAEIARTIKVPATTVQRHVSEAIVELDEIICLMTNENNDEHSDI